MGQRLGQHFLKNEEIIENIISSLNLRDGEIVIEIGPGTGALTKPLVQACAAKNCKLIAIERDEALATLLAHEIKQSGGQIEIIKADALRELPRLADKITSYKLVGNIPYYITGHLLRVIGELEHKPELSVLMVQKEVAERVSAEPPEMNLLAAATQIWADVSILMNVGRADFSPPPEVDSAVIRLSPKSQVSSDKELENYYKTIKAVFKQPRKKLSNNISKEILAKAGISPDLRGQNLFIEDLLRLSMVYF